MYDSALLSDEHSDSYIPLYSESSAREIESSEVRGRIGSNLLKATVDPRQVDTIRYAFRELDRISRLGPDWDSYNAPQVTQRTLIYALEVFKRLMDGCAYNELPQIAPTTDGGVGLYWQGNAKELEVEVEAPFKTHLYFFDELTGAELSDDVGVNLDLIKDKLGVVLG